MYGIFKANNGKYIEELEIRIWDQKKKKMYYKEDIKNQNIEITEVFEYKEFEKEKKEKRFIPMLCTGELDKNKKKIYQGDILKTSHGIFEVKFYNSAFALYNLEKNQHFEYMCNIPSMMGKIYEIIGNIFEGTK